MQEITGALDRHVASGLVLTAVFLPMAFFGGSTGVIYRQFSVTIVSAMSLSIMCALVLTPALCATLLTPIEDGHHQHGSGLLGRFFTWFNNSFEATRSLYYRNLERVLNRTKTTMAVYGLDRGGHGGPVPLPAHRASCRTKTRASSSI